MAFDVGSPERWVQDLEEQLRNERSDLDIYSGWYQGEQPLAHVGPKCEEAYRWLLRRARRNWASLTIDAVADRLAVEGFRFSADANPESTVDPWKLWQASNMDAAGSSAMLEALIVGRCPVMVTRRANGQPRITAEDPRQCIVAYNAGSDSRAAALKLFVDANGYRVIELMLPGKIHKWRSNTPQRANSTWISAWSRNLGSAFGEREELDGEEFIPVVELRANRRIGRPGQSELAGRIPNLEAIDKLTADMLVAAEYGAFRQRWATGLQLTEDGAGNPIEPFKHAVSRLWVEENEDAKFGEFDATDLTNYIKAIEAQVQHLAAITKTPPHYLLSGMTNLSADAIRAAEAGLVTRARRHHQSFGETWEEVMRLALRIVGDPRSGDDALETQWRNPETRTNAELADALTKLASIGVPFPTLAEIYGFTPVQIDRMVRERSREALQTASLAALPSPVRVNPDASAA